MMQSSSRRSPATGTSTKNLAAWERGLLLLLLFVSTALLLYLGVGLDLMSIGRKLNPDVAPRWQIYPMILYCSVPALLSLYGLRSKAANYAFGAVFSVLLLATVTSWHPHKRFLRDLRAVDLGMSFEEMNSSMGHHVLRSDSDVDRSKGSPSDRPSRRSLVFPILEET